MNNDRTKAIREYDERKKKAEAQAKITAKAAANDEVARIYRVAKHVDRDALDDVWQEKYDSVYREQIEAFEFGEDTRTVEEQEDDARRLNEFFLDNALKKRALFGDSALTGEDRRLLEDHEGKPVPREELDEWAWEDEEWDDPIFICHECQSRPCRCEEFAEIQKKEEMQKAARQVFTDEECMDMCTEPEDDWDGGACSTCHNRPCLCGPEPDGF